MALLLKIGKENVQGYPRVLASLNMTDCYSYGLSALVAIEFLRLNKSYNTGAEMGFCISALRQAVFAKIKRDPDRRDRLPLGTILWGDHNEFHPEYMDNPSLKEALGDLQHLVSIWAQHIEKENCTD